MEDLQEALCVYRESLAELEALRQSGQNTAETQEARTVCSCSQICRDSHDSKRSIRRPQVLAGVH